jgi:hypothetical protein
LRFYRIPLNPPQSGPDVNVLLLVFVLCVISSIGFDFTLALVLSSKATLASAFKSGVARALTHAGTTFTLGSLWRFPTPMGCIWGSSTGVPAALLFAIHDAFGLRAVFGANIRRKILPLLLLTLLPIVFLLVFPTCRVVFS